MQEDFHYYATYCAAQLAGYSHDESLAVAYAAQLPDWCSRTFLHKLKAPLEAATTQLQLEMMDARSDPASLQDITRIWASFHFLPYDLNAQRPKCSKRYLRKYRLICDPNGQLVADTVNLAQGKGLEAAGLAMHVLADTWAHRWFAGTPSLVINNVSDVVELVEQDGVAIERPVSFKHNPLQADDLETGSYTNTLYQFGESAIMNLGHGRAGHLPDYSFARYRYLPAWGGYRQIVKDNPADYLLAFKQMVHALACLRAGEPFAVDRYADDAVGPWVPRINQILTKRQLIACDDWKALGQELSGQPIEDFDLDKHDDEYLAADKDARPQTVLGRFFLAALAQKSMVTGRIFKSGNPLAGHSIDFDRKGFKGIRDYRHLVDFMTGGGAA